ncbi:MAG TPA: efflux RND transporter periplasmic adaptor subunit, partial [Steroidobacteraceae bacterium]|nr:efflux RND transporter periplasmic adaptor subunit [Steroidobacteraceae bacterium]
MTISKRGFVALAALAALAGAIGWWNAGRSDHPIEAVPAGERKVLYWYDPMVPDQHFSKPGKSPFMDMQLQPKYADEEAKSGIEVSPVTQHSLGVRTVAVEKGRLGGELAVSGTIAWDLRLERVVSARTEIIVDRLYVKAPFAKVRRGEPLASVIAPAWSSALAEAQAIAQSAEAGTRELAAAAQTRLRALGVPDGTQ